MKPILLLGTIAGGMVGIGTLAVFDAGLRAPAAPGSIIAVLAQTPGGNFVGRHPLGASSPPRRPSSSARCCSRLSRKKGGDLAEATAEMEAMKGKKSSVAGLLARHRRGGRGPLEAAGRRAGPRGHVARRPIHRIVFACDAGMGSSAMGASVLRNKIKKAGFTDVTVTNLAISNLTDDVDLIVTHQDLTPRAQSMSPSAQHVSVDNFMNSPQYDAIVEELKTTNAQDARPRVDRPAGRHPERGCRPAAPHPGRHMSDVLTQSQIKVPGAATQQGRRHPRGRAAPGRRRGGHPAYVDAMFEREKSVSTYMGNFLAIPHGTNEAKDSITRSALSVVRYDAPIDWDGNEVRFAVGIAGVENGHLEILGKIAIVFSDTDEVDKLLAARSAEELYQLLQAVNED